MLRAGAGTCSTPMLRAGYWGTRVVCLGCSHVRLIWAGVVACSRTLVGPGSTPVSGGVLAAAGATGGGMPATFEDPERAGRTYVIYDAPKARLYPASTLQWAESECTLQLPISLKNKFKGQTTCGTRAATSTWPWSILVPLF